MKPTLDGVPETTLWTLHNRASEALRPDAMLDDPLAVDVYRELDHPYHQRFGTPSQSHPLRARCFDDALRAALDEHAAAPWSRSARGCRRRTGAWPIRACGG